MAKLSGAVQESTRFVAKGTAAGTAAVILVFGVLHLLIPAVPFGIGVIISAVLGCLVATGNFLLMAVVAEKAASEENYDNAKHRMTLSYRYRTLGQVLFIILVIVIPGLQFMAGILPLLIPGMLIRGKGVVDYKKKRAAEKAEEKQKASDAPQEQQKPETEEAAENKEEE